MSELNLTIVEAPTVQVVEGPNQVLELHLPPSGRVAFRINAGWLEQRPVNGGVWQQLIELATLEGPQGEQGPQGATGAQGPKGDTGDTGPAGSDANVTNANVNSAISDNPSATREVLGSFPIYSVTNAQRLAGTRSDNTTPLIVRDIVKVTDQGNRIEMYLGGADFTNPNWLVIENTVELTFDLTSNIGPSLSEYSINGVTCPLWAATNTGWVKVMDGIPVGDVDGSFYVAVGVVPAIFQINGKFFGASSGSAHGSSYLTLMSDVIGHFNAVSMMTFQSNLPPRASVTIGFF